MIEVPKPSADAPYRKEILGIIQTEIDKHERSAQIQIGPSEAGSCETQVAFKLAYGGNSDEEKQGGWAAHRGTIIHNWLDVTFKGADRFMPDGSQRFYSDLELAPVTDLIAGGHLDLYDKLYQRVIDWKCPGDWTMKQVRSGQWSETYYVQAQLYAMGLEEMGYPISSTALFFLPACGDDVHGMSKGAILGVWDYERSVAEAAIARVQRLQNMIDVAGPEKVLAITERKASFCSSCPAYIGNRDRRANCPGVVSKPVRPERDPSNPFA